MHMADYWSEKNDALLKDKEIFKEWNVEDQIIVRKMIIMKVLNIPVEGLTFFLRRDKWLEAFAMNTVEKLDKCKLMEQNFVNKRDRIIEKYFYEIDYKKLSSYLKQQNQVQMNAQAVCDVIIELLKPETYNGLTHKQQEEVELYETIYFCPLELLNGYIEQKTGSEVYYSILADQWKTANDMAANISAQRNNMNNFFVSLMSIVIGGILYSDQLLGDNIIAKTVLFVAVAVIGFICCCKWIDQIENYGKLNAAKYDIINDLERYLPANVMSREWLCTEKNARKQKRKINFSEQEIGIARLYQIAVIIVPVIMLIETWWEKICMLIQSL